MTQITRPVRRVVPRERRNLVVTLFPATGDRGPEIEVREARRRVGYRVPISTLFTMLATRAAGIAPARRKRGAR